MQDPRSDILAALYRNDAAEAARLAEAPGALTIWEAAALGRDAADWLCGYTGCPDHHAGTDRIAVTQQNC